jgi:hypothetical protein
MAEATSHSNNELKQEEEPKIEQMVVSSDNKDEVEQVGEDKAIQEQVKPEQVQVTPDCTTFTTTATTNTSAEQHEAQPAAPLQTTLSGNGRILKEAFPDVEDDIIEAILHSQAGNVDSSFEILLGMSDPNYKSTPAPPAAAAAAAQTVQQQQQDEAAPPMPPRPHSNHNQAPSVEEQLRMDEEFAKKIYMQDEERLHRKSI